MHDIPELNPRELREFGLLTGGIVAFLFGLFFPWLLGRALPIWPWLVFGVLGFGGLVAPLSLRPVYRAWMQFGLLLSKVTTPLIMGLIFYALITPIALFLKLAGKDAMCRQFDEQESYRVVRQAVRNDSLEHPY